MGREFSTPRPSAPPFQGSKEFFSVSPLVTRHFRFPSARCSPFVFNNFQDAPPATPSFSSFCIVARAWVSPNVLVTSSITLSVATVSDGERDALKRAPTTREDTGLKTRHYNKAGKMLALHKEKSRQK
jgi:hypothetical protein